MAPIELVDYYDEFTAYYPDCELQTKQWFVDNIKDDWRILDCGANIGYYSILFSRLAPNGKIWAFEPTETVEKLKNNLDHNNITNVEIITTALSDKNGKFRDKIYYLWGFEPLDREFFFTTIDRFVKENNISRLDCIKIDVDSYDFSVLRGARDTILEFNPYIMIELNHALSLRNEAPTQALQWMAELGYEHARIFDDENFLFKRGVENSRSLQISIIFPANRET